MFGKSKDFAQVVVDPDIIRRVDTIPLNDLQVHFETLIIGLGVTYDEWVRGAAPPDEIEITIQAMAALWAALQKRAPK